jgi:uncharacterized membrane protein YkvA (DUF1232 family)
LKFLPKYFEQLFPDKHALTRGLFLEACYYFMKEEIMSQSVKMVRVKKEGKLQVKGRMKNLLMFLPNMLKLMGKLLVDNRVPITEKALFAAAIIYVISPIDFIPDVFPFIGQVDDIYVVALTLLRLLNRTDESVVREHWDGGGDIVSLANSIAGIAPSLLPKRVARVLSSRVEMGSAGKIMESIKNRKGNILVEIPEIEKP